MKTFYLIFQREKLKLLSDIYFKVKCFMNCMWYPWRKMVALMRNDGFALSPVTHALKMKETIF